MKKVSYILHWIEPLGAYYSKLFFYLKQNWRAKTVFLLMICSVSSLRAQFPAIFDLANLDGANGFRVRGVRIHDLSSTSVDKIGDFNGDGIGDIIIGARNANFGAGESYIVFGQSNGFEANLELSSLDGSNGFVLRGIDFLDRSGRSVSGAGDFNGDGFDDVIIGAPSVSFEDKIFAGASYIIFGGDKDFMGNLELSDLDGSNGFIIRGKEYGAQLGFSVSEAGDVNGDGLDDIIIGAVRADPEERVDAGRSYVIFGQSTIMDKSLELSSLNGNNGFSISGIDEQDISGNSVSGVGDINGDGLDDIIIGAMLADQSWGLDAGESYVIFGRNSSFEANLELSSLDGNNGFIIKGIKQYDGSGNSVSGAGDVNGDGLNDIIIGASGTYPGGLDNTGECYIVFGKYSNFDSDLELSTLNGSNGFIIHGINAGDQVGRSVSGAGDINDDGLDDIIVGAPEVNSEGKDRVGESYIIFGRRTEFEPNLELSNLNGSNGFIIQGIEEVDVAGNSVSGAGDINGDSLDDIIIGAVGADPNGRVDAGESYVIFGRSKSTDLPPKISTFPLNLFPNPSYELLIVNSSFFHSAGKVKISLLDQLGREFIVEQIKQDSESYYLNLQNIPKGVYTLKAMVDALTATKRFVKQ